ncbi:unnamed protein product [Prunus brigantina]
MKRDISPDLRMLENQLPFFILKDLFDPDKLFHAIYREGTEDDWERIFVPGIEVNQFVDFMRILCQPMEPKTRGKLKSPTIPNMAELHQAGVKFKVGTSESLFDIKFSSGLTFRNLLAFEQCHCKNMNYLTNYVFLMKRLVSSSKDVEPLLVEHGIVQNWIGGVIVSNYYYATLCDELNNYCRTRRHKWMANLRQNYFNTLWSTVSVIAASILLILTKHGSKGYLNKRKFVYCMSLSLWQVGGKIRFCSIFSSSSLTYLENDLELNCMGMSLWCTIYMLTPYILLYMSTGHCYLEKNNLQITFQVGTPKLKLHPPFSIFLLP